MSGMKYLDSKAVWLFFFGNLAGSGILLFPFVIAMTVLRFEIEQNRVDDLMPISDFLSNLFGWIGLFLILCIGLAYLIARLAYQFYRYELRDDGFRKEHGILWKKYVTIPYERIQNVDIYRGVFARILGLSDLQIQTAGMSLSAGSYGGFSEGRLPGISQHDAEKLRDELIKRARGKHDGI